MSKTGKRWNDLYRGVGRTRSAQTLDHRLKSACAITYRVSGITASSIRSSSARPTLYPDQRRTP